MRMKGSLRNIRQREAVQAFIKLGGVERKGKGSHKVVNINNVNLSIPHGILKEGLLRRLIKIAGVTVEEFMDKL